MQASLLGLSGEVLASLVVEPTDTLQVLKEQIAQRVGILPLQQRLLHRKEVLRAGQTLGQAGIEEGCSINLVRVAEPVVATAQDWWVDLWQVELGTSIRTLDDHGGNVASINFSADSALLVTASFDCTARIYDVASGECLHTLYGHEDAVTFAVFSKDGAWVLTSCVDGGLRLWDVATGVCLQTFPGHDEAVWCAAFSGDASWVASGSTDATAALWSVATCAKIRTLRGHTGRVRAAVFCPDGALLLTGSEDRTAKTWRVEDGTEVITFYHTSKVNTASFSAEGAWVITAADSGQVRIFDTCTAQVLFVLPAPAGGVTASCAVLSVDGTLVLVAYSDGTAHLRNVETGAIVQTFMANFPLRYVALSS